MAVVTFAVGQPVADRGFAVRESFCRVALFALDLPVFSDQGKPRQLFVIEVFYVEVGGRVTSTAIVNRFCHSKLSEVDIHVALVAASLFTLLTGTL